MQAITIRKHGEHPQSFLARTRGEQLVRGTQLPEPGRLTASRELKLSASHAVVGCILFLDVMRLVLWAVIRLWLFET